MRNFYIIPVSIIERNAKDWILTKNHNQTIGKIIRYLKAKSTKLIRDMGHYRFRWQRNYYEHVVRDDKELDAIREYITNNPAKWDLDRENYMSRNFNMGLDKYFRDIFIK